jgi:chemotaxis protein methyltransferase WspC
VELLLRQRIGLAPESLGTIAIQDAVQVRMRACQAPDFPAYERLVQVDADEFDELVERIVVPETWFFRDRTPFRCLRHFLRQRNSAGPMTGRMLRLLSVPCSSGEEAYSLAITLLDEGLAPTQFQVTGVDISQRVLRRAAEASYGETSFRQADSEVLRLRGCYFHDREGKYEVIDEARQAVHFQRGNLVSAGFLADAPPLDVIFCRNLLIYLDASARRAALANVQRLLAPGGLFYVGHVEGPSLAGGGFQRYAPEFPFGFVRQASGNALATMPSSVAPQVSRGAPAAPLPGWKSESRGTALSGRREGPGGTAYVRRDPAEALVPPPRAAASPGIPLASSLEAARAAADQGKLELAATLCEQLLGEQELLADVHCLLGVVRQATGQLDEAERLFQQTLFLEPKHREALTHLMLLASRRGDAQAAGNFRRRLLAANEEVR